MLKLLGQATIFAGSVVVSVLAIIGLVAVISAEPATADTKKETQLDFVGHAGWCDLYSYYDVSMQTKIFVVGPNSHDARCELTESKR